jgi:hypothetical protein
MVYVPILKIDLPEPRLQELIPGLVTAVLGACTFAYDAGMFKCCCTRDSSVDCDFVLGSLGGYNESGPTEQQQKQLAGRCCASAADALPRG